MFIDDLLLDFAAWGFRSRRTWLTTSVALVSGRNRRNAERTRPQFRFVAPYDRLKQSHAYQLMEAFDVCMGSVHSFRFRDKQENQLADVVIGTAVGGGESMQLIKPASFGGFTYSRVITKPADSTKYNLAGGYEHDATPLSLTQDDGGGAVPLAFTVDYLTGLVAFTATAGAIIRATGEFHVPVHFEDDELEFALTTYHAHSADIMLLEDFGA